MPSEAQREFGILQIKEKFSELRTYYAPRSDAISRLVFEAAQLARRVCDECGAFGALYRVGTYLTIKCDACAAALARDRREAVIRVPTGEMN